MSRQSGRPRVLVLGGGFAGLNVVRGLKGAPVDVVLIDRENYHLFQPLLYQVATAALNPSDIAYPLRSALRRQRNVSVLLANAVEVDLAVRCDSITEISVTTTSSSPQVRRIHTSDERSGPSTRLA